MKEQNPTPPPRTALALPDVWIMVALGLLAAVAVACLRPALVDDAFIYLRLAENIAGGGGWVYNAGEYVNPATSPAYVMAVAALVRLTGAGPHNLLLGYSLGMVGIPLVLYYAFRREGRGFAMTMALIGGGEAVLLHSVGLETSCFLLAVLLAAYLYQSGRHVACGVACGLVGLLRPEGVALIGVVLLLEFIARRKIAWPALLAALAVLTPWILFSLFYFESVLPNSIGVKAAQSDAELFHPGTTWLGGFLGQPRFPWLTFPLAFAGCIHVGREFFSGRGFSAVVVLFALVQVVGYTVLRAPIYWWYFAPGNLAVNLCVVLACYRGMKWGWRRFSRAGPERVPARTPRAAAALPALALLVPMAFVQALPFAWPHPYRLSKEYTDVGSWIANNTAVDSTVACMEIGYIGYFSRRPVRDIAGLLHAGSADHIRAGDWSWWFELDPPEIAVIHAIPIFGEPSPASWPPHLLARFKREYERVFQSGSMLVVRRVVDG